MTDRQARITCPWCNAVTAETMPEHYCLWFFDCPACHARLSPKPGDCCVFCSFADKPCPPRQTSP